MTDEIRTDEPRTDETRTDEGTAVADAAPEASATADDSAAEHLPAVAASSDMDYADLFTGATGPDDREWTHDPLERSFFSAVGRGYVIGIVVLGLFGFIVTRSVAKGWGMGAAVGVGIFVAVWAGVLGAVVMVGRWAMRNEELIRGNETGHGHHEGGAPVDEGASEPEPSAGEAEAAAEPPPAEAEGPPAEAEVSTAGSEPSPAEADPV